MSGKCAIRGFAASSPLPKEQSPAIHALTIVHDSDSPCLSFSLVSLVSAQRKICLLINTVLQQRKPIVILSRPNVLSY